MANVLADLYQTQIHMLKAQIADKPQLNFCMAQSFKNSMLRKIVQQKGQTQNYTWLN